MEQRCKVLTIENEALKAEVEMYRNEAASFRNVTGDNDDVKGERNNPEESNHTNSDNDDFVKGGDGTYAKSKEVLLENLHGAFNILCCSLSNDDSVLATGGADQFIAICQWGRAFGSETTGSIVETACRFNCDAPVITIDFARKGLNTKFLAAGCMDGNVRVLFYQKAGTEFQVSEVAKNAIKHTKYVRSLAWSPTENILATASADGCVQVHKLEWDLINSDSVKMEKIQTLQLPGPVESICFQKDHLCCYARGSPYLMYFDVQDNFAQHKINLNQGPGNAGFDEHVSMCIMDMASYGDYLALATDTSRNIIMDWKSGKFVRNLYGHRNDGFSQPKIAWSNNGQYLYGNTQEESLVCVWDIASSTIVDRLEGHSNCVRDMFSSNATETLVTTSFDKKTQIWLAPID